MADYESEGRQKAAEITTEADRAARTREADARAQQDRDRGPGERRRRPHPRRPRTPRTASSTCSWRTSARSSRSSRDPRRAPVEHEAPAVEAAGAVRRCRPSSRPKPVSHQPASDCIVIHASLTCSAPSSPTSSPASPRCGRRSAAVVRRFGQVVARPGPGLWVGLPWGIDRVDRVPVRTARQLTVGYDPDTWSDVSGHAARPVPHRRPEPRQRATRPRLRHRRDRRRNSTTTSCTRIRSTSVLGPRGGGRGGRVGRPGGRSIRCCSPATPRCRRG